MPTHEANKSYLCILRRSDWTTANVETCNVSMLGTISERVAEEALGEQGEMMELFYIFF